MHIARERFPAPIALLAFGCLLMVVGVRHEPWFDEAQAWLIARDNTPWSLLARGVRYEGTPALWHGLLWIVQRLGLPYAGLWLVSAALALIGAWIVLYKAPFPIWLRIALIFTYFFAYQYSIVARSYALDLMFLPLLAWLFAHRSSRPLIYAGALGLLANTNAHSFMLSAVLALEFSWTHKEKLLAFDRKVWGAVTVIAVFAVAAILQAWPPRNINFIIPKRGDNPLLNTAVLFTEAFIERGDIFSQRPPNATWRLAGLVATLLILAPAVLLWAKDKKLLLCLGLLSALAVFSALKYGNYWHAGIIFLTFVFCLWITWDSRKALSPPLRRYLDGALMILAAYQIWCAAAASVRDFAGLYSGGPAAARALQDHRRTHPNERIGVAGFKGFAVQPYFSTNLFANYEGGAAKPAYYLWRRLETPIPGLGEAQWRALAAGGYDRLLLSTFNVMGWNGPARYIIDARKVGYCPSDLFSGAMIWKTYALETDDMMIFDRCAKPPRFSSHPSP